MGVGKRWRSCGENEPIVGSVDFDPEPCGSLSVSVQPTDAW